MWDIDYLYEKHLEALAEEQYEASLTQKDLDADRFEMWCVILGDIYAGANKNRKKHMKEWFTTKYSLKPRDVDWNWALEHDCPVYKPLEEIRGMSFDMICVDECINFLPEQKVTYTTLGPITVPSVGSKSLPCKKPIQEKETNMGYEVNLEVEQRNHLKRRLENLQSEKTGALQDKFFINAEHPAKTKDEVLAAFKAGEFSLEDYDYQDGKLRDGYRAVAFLKNPKTDREGFAAAKVLLGKAYAAAKDAIIVMPLADGLKALNEFEAKQF